MNRSLRIGIVAASVVVALVLVAFYYRHARLYPSTDDAYVDADVVAVAPQVMGPVVNVAVVDNQSVRATDLLFEIDPRPFVIDVQKAKAQLDQTGQNVTAAADGVTSAEAEVQQAKAQLRLMQVQYRRVAPLAKLGAVSYQDRDRVQAALDEARAGLADAEARLSQARNQLGDVGDDNPDRRAALAQLESAELQLSYTKVTASVNGNVTNLDLIPGSFASPGVPMLSLVDTDSWRVIAYMKETQLRDIRPGQVARVYLPAYPGVVFDGRVQGIGWGIEPADGASDPGGLPSVSPTVDWVRMAQRFPVRITLVNPEPAHPLRKEMRATVRIDTTTGPDSDAATDGGGS